MTEYTAKLGVSGDQIFMEITKVNGNSTMGGCVVVFSPREKKIRINSYIDSVIPIEIVQVADDSHKIIDNRNIIIRNGRR